MPLDYLTLLARWETSDTLIRWLIRVTRVLTLYKYARTSSKKALGMCNGFEYMGNSYLLFALSKKIILRKWATNDIHKEAVTSMPKRKPYELAIFTYTIV